MNHFGSCLSCHSISFIMFDVCCFQTVYQIRLPEHSTRTDALMAVSASDLDEGDYGVVEYTTNNTYFTVDRYTVGVAHFLATAFLSVLVFLGEVWAIYCRVRWRCVCVVLVICTCMCVCVWGGVYMCVCVCVCVREREREVLIVLPHATFL